MYVVKHTSFGPVCHETWHLQDNNLQLTATGFIFSLKFRSADWESGVHEIQYSITIDTFGKTEKIMLSGNQSANFKPVGQWLFHFSVFLNSHTCIRAHS